MRQCKSWVTYKVKKVKRKHQPRNRKRKPTKTDRRFHVWTEQGVQAIGDDSCREPGVNEFIAVLENAHQRGVERKDQRETAGLERPPTYRGKSTNPIVSPVVSMIAVTDPYR